MSLSPLFHVQESKPELITAIEDCEYTFLWFTAAACPLKSNVQNDCRVTNPATGKEAASGFSMWKMVLEAALLRLHS